MEDNRVNRHLKAYKRKFYKNQLLKGSILTAALVASAYLVVNALEYFGRFSSEVRAVLFFGFLAAAGFALVRWVMVPIYHLLNERRQLSDEDAARQIGDFFPQVGDRLLNFLQLRNTPNTSPELLAASLRQKATQLEPVRFEEAIQYKKNRRYLRFLIIPVALGVGVLLFFTPEFFTQSTTRLVNFDKDFAPKAPFTFNLLNDKLSAFRDESFDVSLQLEGDALPENVYLLTDRGSKIRMAHQGDGRYTHEFKNVQRGFDFHFQAIGFRSNEYELELRERPHLRGFQAYLDYPAYTGKQDERTENTGNLVVPEGTRIRWTFSTRQAESLQVQFEDEKQPAPAEKSDENFRFEKQIMESGSYEIKLKNEYSTNRDAIAYYLQVVPDEYPEITLKAYQDSVLYDYLMLGGSVMDDYGISRLSLRYRLVDENGKPQTERFQSEPIEFSKGTSSQEYFHRVNLGKMELKPGQRLEYYVEVWDNDGINGSKSSRTGRYQFAVPDKKALREEISKESADTEKELGDAKKKADELEKNVESLRDRLKGKKKLSWQDKKAVEELLKKNQSLKKELEEAAKKNAQLNERQNRFSEQEERIAEKAEQLQKLMDEVLDEETQKLFEELNRLLEENAEAEDLQKVLEKLQRNSENIEKELDRSLEMFKQLQVELEMQNLQKQLDELAKKQEELAEQTKKMDEENAGETSEKPEEESTKPEEEQPKGENTEEGKKEEKPGQDKQEASEKPKNTEEMKKEQEKLNQEFEDFQKQLDETQKKNEELRNPKNMDDLKPQSQDIEQEQQKAQESLEQGEQQKAGEQQQKAGQKMQQMAQQMSQMMQSSSMEAAMEDYQTLRQILDNLMTLSFEQEEILQGFSEVQQGDPRFLDLSQRQLKLKDDAQIVEDSLRALAERVFQIESFITRELTTMNDYMDQSIEAVKERRPRVATTKQQLTMTSINNLALLLNDVLDQMQQAMASMMPGQQMANKPGGTPNMSEMQKQLNQQINGLKKSGKTGRQLSEELAKMAARQEAIRRALQKQMSDNPDGKKEGGGSVGELLEEMEKTEEDLVNKRLTDELIERQRKILTRLLESEKAKRERDEKKEREAERAKPKERELPPAFEEYLKLKKQQIEQLKTIPPALSPYYKKEVHEYFQSIKD